MSSSTPKHLSVPSQKACEDFVRFILDFSMLMQKHVEMILKTLQSTNACMVNGANSIDLTAQVNIRRSDEFEFRNKLTKNFEPMRARDFDEVFRDPVSLARPYSEEISENMAGIRLLDLSVRRLVSSLSVLRSIDDISMQRLDQAARTLNAINEAMGDVLVQYRLHGQLSENFVEDIQRKLLMAMSGPSGGVDRKNVFNEFLRKQ